ncbi:MAG: phage DNA encapsidation protein [archaeon]|nr:phage DNA encapsidation protein [archaeon]
MASKQKHYNIDRIDKEDANFNLIYGEKSNGKSYQVKHKKGVLHYLETGKRFILLRRWVADITTLWIESYFNDVDVYKLTDGKYEMITVYRKEIYFSNLDDKGKVKRGEKIGYAMALSTEQHYSGASFLDVDSIIFEEFMERGGCYIKNEADRLMIFYNTVDRKRGVTKLWLVGNTISRICPYLVDWDLQKVMKNQKQGDINTIIVHNEENDVKIAIEYCESSGGKQMAIGHASKMIDSGSWQTTPQPKLTDSLKNYKKLYRIIFFYSGFKFMCLYLKHNITHESCWFIHPYSGEISDKQLVFSDIIKTSKWWQKDIYNPLINNKNLRELLMTFKESNIFYSDDLTGTDFKQAIDFTIRK